MYVYNLVCSVFLQTNISYTTDVCELNRHLLHRQLGDFLETAQCLESPPQEFLNHSETEKRTCPFCCQKLACD